MNTIKKFVPAYPAIVLENPKFPRNASAIIRLASCFGIKQVWYTGQRMEDYLTGMKRLPREERMKGYSEVEFIGYDYPFEFLKDGIPVIVELVPNATPLTYFKHPENAVYVFGPEDGGVSKGLRVLGHHFVIIPSRHCLNLATAVSAVLTHRVTQMNWMPEGLFEYKVPSDFISDTELG
jgi:tRNA(Leu) C34 or U34 (ribose-2'-O)-methylase TrmL